MHISELCIRRPVMTILLSLAAIAAGIVAYTRLPVAAVPRVDFPVISVFASFPGASPETMATSVALPLEREFSTIAGLESMNSTSGQDTLNLTLQFQLGRNIDSAAQDVQAALTRAQRRLPVDMTTPPSYRKVNPADAPVLLLTLGGGDVPLYRLQDVASTIIAPALSRVQGVALGVAGHLTRAWSVFANYTYLDSEVLQGVSDYCLANPGTACANSAAALRLAW